jgi:anti-sigma factor (TIGR02949 family)
MAANIAGMFHRLLGRKGDCAETREDASAYLEGELPSSRTEWIRKHLERCGPCRNFFDTLKATMQMLRSMPERETPLDLKQNILKKARGVSNGDENREADRV